MKVTWNYDPTYMDVEHANMYGCTPCPKCGEAYRCVFNNAPTLIQCDDCGFKEAAVRKPTATETPATGGTDER